MNCTTIVASRSNPVSAPPASYKRPGRRVAETQGKVCRMAEDSRYTFRSTANSTPPTLLYILWRKNKTM